MKWTERKELSSTMDYLHSAACAPKTGEALYVGTEWELEQAFRRAASIAVRERDAELHRRISGKLLVGDDSSSDDYDVVIDCEHNRAIKEVLEIVVQEPEEQEAPTTENDEFKKVILRTAEKILRNNEQKFCEWTWRSGTSLVAPHPHIHPTVGFPVRIWGTFDFKDGMSCPDCGLPIKIKEVEG